MRTKPRVNTHMVSAQREYLLPHGEPVALADIREALIIKEGDLFLITDVEGNVPRLNTAGYGLYKGDTKYLSVYDLSFDSVRPVVLLSTAELGYSSEHHLTNPPMSAAGRRILPKESLEMRRQRVINECLMEKIQVTNFNIFRAPIDLRFEFDADFADIFEVRGAKRQRRDELSPPVVEKEGVTFGYKGLDGIPRTLKIRFSPPPDQIWYNGVLFSVTLGHRQTTSITVIISPDGVYSDGDFAAEFNRQASSYGAWLDSSTEIFTSNEFFNAMLERSLRDMRLLMTQSDVGHFVSAGIPWFNCLFGRDSIITSLQILSFNSRVARNTLRLLAQWQGREVDEWRDKEPGKILHELRTGEMASAGEIPMKPYYGSIDATPLFLMLAAEYVAWTRDLALIRELEPNLMAALSWIDEYGDSDRCGYVEYWKRSPKGLLHQGWKDSRNGMVNADGTLFKPPVAPVEVQAYVYAAKQGMAWLLSLTGKGRMSTKLRREAAALKTRFNRDFWIEEEEFYGLALGGKKEAVTSITSNPGHCLWTRIVAKDKAGKVVERLFSNDMFSGWGIRTLSSQAARYNPLGYHLGSVWPHNNSLTGMGLKRYGFEDELNELATALYDCCRSLDYFRLPELFSGVPRTAYSSPVRYPVACPLQAWAAGSLLMLLQAILGFAPNAPEKGLKIVRPKLPYWLEYVEVKNLRVGESAIDLLFEQYKGRTRVSVLGNERVEISVVRNQAE